MALAMAILLCEKLCGCIGIILAGLVLHRVHTWLYLAEEHEYFRERWDRDREQLPTSTAERQVDE